MRYGKQQTDRAGSLNIRDLQLTGIIKMNALRQRNCDRVCKAVTTLIEENQHRTVLQIENIISPGTVDVSQIKAVRVERLFRLAKPGQCQRLAKMTAPKVRPAGHTVRADADPVLLPGTQYVAESKHLAGITACIGKCDTCRLSNIDTGRPAITFTGIHPHTFWADQRQI